MIVEERITSFINSMNADETVPTLRLLYHASKNRKSVYLAKSASNSHHMM